MNKKYGSSTFELKKLLQDHKLSQRQAGIRSGVNPSTINRVLSGKERLSARSALKLKKLFRCPLVQLYEDAR